MKNRKITIFLVSFFILLFAVFSFWYHDYRTTVRAPKLAFVTENNNIRPFKFVNQEGDTITHKDVLGKVLVVEYFFTTCKGICPKMNENMAKVHQAFKGNSDVLILSHTVDPKKDTIDAMKAYSMRFEADPKKWMFLTGDKKALYDMARYSYLVSAGDEATDDIESDFIHTEIFVIVDKKGRIRMPTQKDGSLLSYDGTDEKSVAKLIKDVEYLLGED